MLPQPARLRVRRHFSYRPGRHGPPVIPGQHDDGALQVQHPEPHDRRRVTAVALRPRPARQPRRGQTRASCATSASSTTSSSARPTGSACRAPTSRTRREPGRSRTSSRRRSAAAAQLRLPNGAHDPGGHVELPALADRVQQGLLNFLYLGRAMVHPDGFSSDPAFQVDGQSVIDTRRLFYDGNSQGGIIGGALTAVARTTTARCWACRDELLDAAAPASTGAPATAERSTCRVLVVHVQGLPGRARAAAVLSLIQTLWDRAEANGYAHHMTDDPLPNTPPHEVLLHVGSATTRSPASGRGRGAHDRGLRAHAVGRPGPRHRPRPPLRDPGDPRASRSPARRWCCGTSARSATEERRDGGHRRPADHEHAAGPPPARLPQSSPGGRRPDAAEIGVPRMGGQVMDVCGSRPCYAGTWTGP